ncbi:MAG TPA: hypothetical protein VHW60_16060 [Caulobacteraceae bacterium]|jgi:hypothetical protein|nr:hypothetical protein [Caulobacteraceae bacterium]
MNKDQPDMGDVASILADPKSRAFSELRDRAAYLQLTGTYPTNLRTRTTRLLTLISSAGRSAPDVADRVVATGIADQLQLATHPMVTKVRDYIEQGYRIRVSQGPNVRKPFYKIWLFKGDDRRTIQIDGSMMDGWA